MKHIMTSDSCLKFSKPNPNLNSPNDLYFNIYCVIEFIKKINTLTYFMTKAKSKEQTTVTTRLIKMLDSPK